MKLYQLCLQPNLPNINRSQSQIEIKFTVMKTNKWSVLKVKVEWKIKWKSWSRSRSNQMDSNSNGNSLFIFKAQV